MKSVLDLIRYTLHSESYKWVGLDLLESATAVYGKTNKFIQQFYNQTYLPTIKEYINQPEVYV